MNSYKKSEIMKAFQKTKIKKGDSVFLTTNLGMLGSPITKNKNLLLVSSRWIFDSLKEIIGKKGNIFVPTYSYSFTKKKKIFNVNSTKSDIGYFPNFFLKQKNIIRSRDPMMSVSGFGPNAKDILLKISNNSYGNNCVFKRLLKLKKLKCCNIGLGYNWIPFIHHLDWVNKVSFRFNKILLGYILDKKKKKKLKWIYFARYLVKETTADGYKIGKMALKKNLFIFSRLANSVIYVINYRNFFKFAKKITKKNKWLTVTGPEFKNLR